MTVNRKKWKCGGNSIIMHIILIVCVHVIGHVCHPPNPHSHSVVALLVTNGKLEAEEEHPRTLVYSPAISSSHFGFNQVSTVEFLTNVQRGIGKSVVFDA